MRILLDECGYTWEKAFDITRRTFAYTNHTVMSEALEKWNEDIFKKTLPRIYQICVELDHRCRADLERTFPGDEGKINYMAVLGDGQVRMANICCYVCHSINGVSQLHSEIIKQSVFHDYFLYSPEKFTNVTNGIAYRRWLLAANPGLTGLLEDTIGPGFKKDASELKKLEKFKADKKVLSALEDVKDANKVIFAQHLKKVTGQEIDPHTLFDVQVKRMHEYKRQHLNRAEHRGAVPVYQEQPQRGRGSQNVYLRSKGRAGLLYGQADDPPDLQAGRAHRRGPHGA